MSLPPDGPQSLDVKHVSEGAPAAYPNGCHVCEVEVDPDTGNIEVVKYTAVNDFGTIINPMLVDGQTHGGVVQGIGQTLLEHVVYDEQGQLLSGSFMDYAMPRAHHTPNFDGVQPSGAGHDQSARRQGLRRGRLRRLADLDHERGGRRAVGIRHQAHRHAGEPGAGLAGDPGRQEPAARSRRNDRVSTEVAVRRAADGRRPPGRGRQRGAFRQPFLHAGAAAAVRLRARRLRGELHRDRPGADRVQRGVGGGADAGRLPDRPHQRAARADRGPVARRGRLCGRGGGRIPTGC